MIIKIITSLFPEKVLTGKKKIKRLQLRKYVSLVKTPVEPKQNTTFQD